MEARIAHLESDVAHICTDIADIKVDLRSLRDRTDEIWFRLAEKIEAGDARLSDKIESVETRLLRRSDWTLALYVGFAAAMLGTMARGFGWI